jgi:glucose-1-phosphate thymidylyltransferase
MTIGLIPCAGTATRIRALPKYLLPIPYGFLLSRLETLMEEHVNYGLVMTNNSNFELIANYAASSVYVADNYGTMTQTVLSSQAHMQPDENVLFGMPDTYIEDDQCYPKLAAALEDGAQVAAALFYARPEQHKKVGMCAVALNQVVDVIDKPQETGLTWLWGALAWQPVFWEHMRPDDPHIGYALPRAIAAGLDVRAVKMVGGYWDCGTYEGYSELVVHLHGRKEPNEMVARL